MHKGYKILETNFKTYIGEIDIIALDKNYVVFVEVKTRLNQNYGMPSEAVDAQKQKKYELVAQEFLIKNRLENVPCRFDVIEITGNNHEINHIIDAFYI